jgi:hypothetical protein
MKPRKTREEKIQAELEKKQQIDNNIKKLLQEQKADERKRRTKRLIERGAIVESLIENPANLSNEEFQEMMISALTSHNKPITANPSSSVAVVKTDESAVTVELE